ncbi:O-succinylbenzoate-CoA ligase [Shewanella piezotolerans WP3]|uniref:O-succinylbenzoate-CoA ligase n=1 Tax=Shewanella piezotolerans (strain WP3 / JCM 13877) TaxID=225849 RepID=B8CUU8_SHEPW|nr:o-succinylbenzoate--CoA ligase [Shewanella piezotolerans]ACJ31424.1 O-succinylbenzoate-CoA ligase [Shewanella piezotolerans WP3]
MPQHDANITMLSPIHQRATIAPNTFAYRIGELKVSYQMLSQQVLAVGEQLIQAGVQRGDRIACIAYNQPELLTLYWACVDHGMLFCPISPRFAPKQLIELIQTHQYTYCWLGDISNNSHNQALHEALSNDTTQQLSIDYTQHSSASAPNIDPSQGVNAILTSGSTGLPKAAVHSLKNHIASANGSKSLIDITAEDSWLLLLPLFHIGGLAIINRCALSGACVVFEDKTVSLATQLSRDKISHLSLVSAQLQKLLDSDNCDLSQVKAMLLGGGVISADLLLQLETLNIGAYTSYGMTEMSSQITTGKAGADSSSGTVLPQRQLKIVNGEIWVKGECLFLGYLTQDNFQRPTDSEGWFYTKDLGHWDENTNLRIDGRADNMFISGGENIQPEEIEAALKLHPQIDDAIVYPINDAQFGNLPAAIIKIASHSTGQPSEAELSEFLANKIARFKRPRQYYPWPDINSVGIKVVRKQVIAAVKR